MGWIQALGLLLLPPLAFGHAVLVESSLSEPVPAERSVAVRLVFNVAVEAALSELRLVSARGEIGPLRLRRGERPNELRFRLPPLLPGSYAIDYRILARDGHLTESALPFEVR